MTQSIRCLLIDDDHDDQLVFSLALQKLNKPVICLLASNGYEGLEKLHDPSNLPDLIFLDLNIPGIHGMECLRRIKSNKQIAHIPVVIFTTSSREEDIVKSKELGALDFILKPDRVTELASKLDKFF